MKKIAAIIFSAMALLCCLSSCEPLENPDEDSYGFYMYEGTKITLGLYIEESKGDAARVVLDPYLLKVRVNKDFSGNLKGTWPEYDVTVGSIGLALKFTDNKTMEVKIISNGSELELPAVMTFKQINHAIDYNQDGFFSQEDGVKYL